MSLEFTLRDASDWKETNWTKWNLNPILYLVKQLSSSEMESVTQVQNLDVAGLVLFNIIVNGISTLEGKLILMPSL